MGIVGFGPAELIVWHRRSTRHILEESAPAIVPHQNVKFTVGTKTQDTAIVITSQRLVGVGLISTQLDQVAIEHQRGSIPNVSIDAIAEQRNIRQIRRIKARAALSPVKIDQPIEFEVRIQSEAKQSTFGSAVHCQIEHGVL